MQFEVGDGPFCNQLIRQRGLLLQVWEQIEFVRGFAHNLLVRVAEHIQECVVGIREPPVRQSRERHQRRVVAEQSFESLLRLLLRSQVLGDAENAIRTVPPTEPDAGIHRDEHPVLGRQRQRTAFPLAPEHGAQDILSFLALVRRMHVQHIHVGKFFGAVS